MQSEEGDPVPGPSKPPVRGPDEPKEKKKRVRQRFSCAECRRLKIKCSKVWPCDACVKGGCAQICPDGQLWKSQGRRIFLADSEDLTRRVSMLKQSHGQNSSPTDRHSHSPTIRTTGPAPSHSHSPLSPTRTEIQEDPNQIVGNTLGTLTIGRETSRYVGKLAGSEYLHEVHAKESEDTGGLFSIGSSPGSDRRKILSAGESLGSVHAAVDLATIRSRLPIWEEEGRALVEIYWNNVDWIQQAVPRPILDSDFLINAYDVATPPNPHKIACVFLVMALGAMYDLSKEPYQARGKELYHLGRACLEHEAGGPSLATVQAMILSGTYILNDYHNNGAETFWPIIGTAIKIAQSIGLHRDGTQFELSHFDIQTRRQVWWELITYDRLQALCFGRPCSTCNRHTDTNFPEPDEQLMTDLAGYHASKHRLAYMMERVLDLQNQIAPLSYSSILELDSELEDFKKHLPEELLSSLDIEELPLSPMIRPHTVLQRFGIRLLVAQTRLHLNRPAFSRALSSDALYPDQSRFGVSFLALYDSAQEIVHLVKQLVFYHPSLIARWWAFWFHAFSAAVCLAAIVIQAPKSSFSRQALMGMSIVCDLSAAARDGCRAKKGLHTLLRLRKRAQAAMIVAAPQEFGAISPAQGGLHTGQRSSAIRDQRHTQDSRRSGLPTSHAQSQTPIQQPKPDLYDFAPPTHLPQSQSHPIQSFSIPQMAPSTDRSSISDVHMSSDPNVHHVNTLPPFVFDQSQSQDMSQTADMFPSNPFMVPEDTTPEAPNWDSIGFAMDDNLGFNIDDFLNEIREDNFALIP